MMKTARFSWWMVLLGSAWVWGPTVAAPHTQVSLVLSANDARPGDEVLAGIRLQMEEGWHTYWINPGDSGAPTEIQWRLPDGVAAGEPRWPLPEKYTDSLADLTTYVYHDEVVIIVPLRLSQELPVGPLEIGAKVSWLECSEMCLPAEGQVSGTLTVADRLVPSEHAALFEAWRKRVPAVEPETSLPATWEPAEEGDSRWLSVSWDGDMSPGEVDFFPFTGRGYSVGAQSVIAVDGGGDSARLRKPVSRFDGAWPGRIPGVWVEGPSESRMGRQVTLAFGGAASEGSVGDVEEALASRSGGPEDESERSLAWMLLLAFVGGLILNVMPCVLPVIALKVLSFVQQAKESPATVRRHGLLYGVGVLASFGLLAGVVVAVQWGGGLASWGMHFQSAGFLIVMTTLVTLVALNLFGVFEVTLGGQTMGAVSGLASKEGSAGAFFNGVLATTLATPCTAPILGTAVGFAFTRPPAIIVLMFLVIGLGLAAPYILLSFLPGLARFLPKPGAWMLRFKVAMGFPMLGAAVWLLTLLEPHYGASGVLWGGIFLVLVGLAAWVWGEFGQRGAQPRLRVGAAVVVILLAGYFLVLDAQMQWRVPRGRSGGGELVTDAQGIPWKRWSSAAVAEARLAGHPVLVDFTADWCVTCQANKKTSLEIESVEQKLTEIGAVAFLGDYTLKDDAITRELRRFGRAGVPLVLVYPADAEEPPVVLPELLTPTMVLEALSAAAQAGS